MKEIRKILTLTLLSGAIIIASPAFAQRPRGESGTSHRGSSGVQRSTTSSPVQRKTSATMPRQNNSAATRVQTHNQATSRPGGSTRPTTQTRPNTSARPSTSTRPSTSSRPSTSTRPTNQTRPSDPGSNTRPATRPGGSNKPSTQTRPNTSTRPGGGKHPSHPSHPGGNTRPSTRPGNGHHLHPSRPGSSVGRPGGYTPAPRPHYSYRRPGYRPPRPGGGYWGAPPPSAYRLRYYLPPRPVYPSYWRPGIPTLGTILGLTFGSFIDAGINSLYQSGYQVAGYVDNAIYLSNVRQLGYLWPEAVINYNDGLMTGTQFYSWSATPDPSRYNMLYRQLVNVYGAPVSDDLVNGLRMVTWWAGEGTGYVTLQYGYSPSVTGQSSYYTSVSYNAVY